MNYLQEILQDLKVDGVREDIQARILDTVSAFYVCGPLTEVEMESKIRCLLEEFADKIILQLEDGIASHIEEENSKVFNHESWMEV